MIKLIKKLFFKQDQISTERGRNHIGVACGIMGMCLNFFLFLIKFVAGILSKSTAILADAFNNLSDIGSSVITFIGFKMSGKPADRDHPFGHGRIEYLAGLFVAIVIIIMAFELGKSSVEKIIHPTDVFYSKLSLVILVISILVKLFMFYLNKGLAKEINSSALRATAQDSLNDTIATFTVLLGVIVSSIFSINLDGILGLFVAAFILVSGIKTVAETINPVLGQPADPLMVKEVQKEVLKDEHILGIHDLIIHNYGPTRLFMSLHAEVPSSGNILELHDVIDTIEKKLKDKFHCEASIHMDPIVIDDERTNNMHNKIRNILEKISPEISMHDFRMTDGHTHTNLIFDIVVPYDFSLSDSELIKQIEEKIDEIDGTYFACINIDKEF